MVAHLLPPRRRNEIRSQFGTCWQDERGFRVYSVLFQKADLVVCQFCDCICHGGFSFHTCVFGRPTECEAAASGLFYFAIDTVMRTANHNEFVAPIWRRYSSTISDFSVSKRLGGILP